MVGDEAGGDVWWNRQLRWDDNLSPSQSVPAYLESILNCLRYTLSASPSIPTQIASVPILITVHYSLSTSLCPSPCHQILLKPVKVPKYSFAAKHRKCDTSKTSKVRQMVQCRLTCRKQDAWWQCRTAPARQ